jgi:putative transposase
VRSGFGLRSLGAEAEAVPARDRALLRSQTQPSQTKTFCLILFGFPSLDAWSCRIVGWAFSSDLKTRVMLDALDMALAARKPDNVVHAPIVVRNTPQLPSALAAREPAFVHRQAVGDTYDSAICENFFATLECELIDRRRFRSHSGARAAVYLFIENFYNPSRRDSA